MQANTEGNMFKGFVTEFLKAPSTAQRGLNVEVLHTADLAFIWGDHERPSRVEASQKPKGSNVATCVGFRGPKVVMWEHVRALSISSTWALGESTEIPYAAPCSAP